MLPTAAEDIPVEENQKGDPRWNEFMGDLFEIVQKNRDNVTFGKGPKAKYLDASIDDPRTSNVLFSSLSERRSVSLEERQRGLFSPSLVLRPSLPPGRQDADRNDDAREYYKKQVVRHLNDRIIAEYPNVIERNKTKAADLEKKIQELKEKYNDPSRMPDFPRLVSELEEVERQIPEAGETKVWAEQSLKEMESTGKIPTIPSKGNKKNEESPQAPEAFYRTEIIEGLTLGIRSLADKYPELNIQEGMRSIIQEGPPPRMDRPDYSAPLSGYGQSFIRGEKEGENVSLSGELDLKDYSSEELDDLLSEMEEDQKDSRPYRIDARGFMNAFDFNASDLPSRAKDFDEVKEMFFPNIPEEKLTPEQFELINNEVEKRLPEVDDDYVNLQNNAEAINEALESDHRIRVGEVQDQVSLIRELAEEGGGEYLKQKYGSLILKEDSQGLVSLKDLRGFPGGDYIESWIRRKYDLDQDDPVRYDQLPNNAEAEVILGNAAKSMEAEWFQDSGKGKEIKRLVEPEVRKRTRARDFINSKYSQKPLGVGSNPKDRRKEKLNRDNYETHGANDPAFLSDRADWIYGTVAQLRDDESLTENQKAAAETWFSYDYWFQNVYDNKHEEENIYERIGNLQDPEFLAAEQARFASRTIGEVLGQKRAESPDDIYDWQKTLNKIPERMQDEQLDEKEAKNEMKAMTEDFLLKKVAEFMVYDGPIISFLASRDVYSKNVEGQYSRRPQNNGGGTSDVADVIFDFISASITARRANGLGRFNEILDELKLKNIQSAKMGEKKTPEEVLSPEEDNSLVDEPEENSKKVINMDDLRSEAVRIYIRQLAKSAISEEFRKGSRRLKSIQMVSLDPSNRSNTSLSKSFNDLMAGADEVDTANRIQNFDEQMSETIAQVTDREAGDQDSSYLDIVDAVTMRSFMLKFKNGLNDRQKQEFDFFYGNGQRDIYKEGQNDASEFVTLDTKAAEKYWKLTFNKSISADRIAQKKRDLDRLLKYAIYRTANESPDFLKILNETIALQKEDVEEALANQNITDQMVEDNNTTISDESDLANIDRLRRQNKE